MENKLILAITATILVAAIMVAAVFVGCSRTDDEQIIGGDTDEGGCLIGAGYSWCEAKQKCLRTWEEPCTENVEVTDFESCVAAGNPVMESYPRQCSANGQTFREQISDAENCMVQGGDWIESAQECVGISKESCEAIGGNFNECASACRNDPEAEVCIDVCVQVCEFRQLVGGDADEHGCIGSAGYIWCESKQKCLRTWEEPCEDEPIVGGDADEHGCIGSAGYIWCESKQKCLRTWEEPCYDNSDVVDFESCVAAGNPVMESYPRQCSTSSGETFVEPIEGNDQCVDQCGDGTCDEIVCLASGCPCAEDAERCPEDCS